MKASIYKLARLPRHQMLRKFCKMFTEAERRMSEGCIPDSEEIALLNECALLASYDAAPQCADITQHVDALVSEAAIGAHESAGDTAITSAHESAADTPAITALRFWINGIRHRLLAETGRFAADWDFIDHEGKLDAARRTCFAGMSVYLEDIRSPYNVGAMFRSAESFGAERVYLSQRCADPLHPRALRTAMGCTDVLPWERRELASLAGPFFALETGGTNLRDFAFPRCGVLIAGSEELGVSPAALDTADASLGRVTIPHYGAKASLNVSAAFAIVMQAWGEVVRLD